MLLTDFSVMTAGPVSDAVSSMLELLSRDGNVR